MAQKLQLEDEGLLFNPVMPSTLKENAERTDKAERVNLRNEPEQIHLSPSQSRRLRS